MSHVAPNRRTPCTGTQKTVATLNGCFEQLRTPVEPIWKNVSLVKDYANPSTPIPPYERLWPETACTSNPSDCSVTPCSPMTASDMVGTGQHQVSSGYFFNSYNLTGSAPLAGCEYQLGWRQVAARKTWFGMLPFTSTTFGFDQVSSQCFMGYSICSNRYLNATPDSVKYLSMTATSTYKSDGPMGLTEASYDSTVTQGRYTGLLSCQSSSAGSTADVSTCITNMQNKATCAGMGVGILVSRYCEIQTAAGRLCDEGETPYASQLNLKWNDTWYDTGGNPHTDTFIEINLDLEANSLVYKTWAVNSGATALYNNQVETWQVTQASLSWESVVNAEVTGGMQTTTQKVNSSMGAGYTADQLQADVAFLLSQYPINNDKTLSWQWVDWHGQVPLVTYDESNDGNPFEFPPNGACNSAAESALLFSGRVLGVPIENGKADRFFDFRHENYKDCGGYLGSVGWGKYNIEDSQHRATTQWVNVYEASLHMFKGAFMKMDANGGALWAAKWAETIVPKKSYNLARPCGQGDKYQLNPNSSSCIAYEDAGNIYLQSPPNIQTGEKCLYYGGSGVSGVYTVNQVDPTTYTLGTLVASGSELPATFDGGTYGILAKLRWQDNVPAFCGRNYITNIANLTCSLEKTGLVTGDKVFAVDAGGNSKYYGVKYVGPNDIKLLGWNGTGSLQYLQCAFGADWSWDDNTSKGDFYTIDWQHNWRDTAEDIRLSYQWGTHEAVSASYCPNCQQNNYDWIAATSFTLSPLRYSQSLWGLDQSITNVSTEAGCLKGSNCATRVVCISPNGETFPQGKTYAFPTSFVCDGEYGSRWQKVVIQTIEDPFFMPPFTGTGCGVETEDIYACCDTCQLDYVSTYPHKPVYEALLTEPNGAPKLRPGFFLGCLSQDKVNVSVDPRTKGNVCNCPQLFSGYGVDYFARFMWASYCACVSGKWAPEYQDIFGVACAATPVEQEI